MPLVSEVIGQTAQARIKASTPCAEIPPNSPAIDTVPQRACAGTHTPGRCMAYTVPGGTGRTTTGGLVRGGRDRRAPNTAAPGRPNMPTPDTGRRHAGWRCSDGGLRRRVRTPCRHAASTKSANRRPAWIGMARGPHSAVLGGLWPSWRERGPVLVGWDPAAGRAAGPSRGFRPTASGPVAPDGPGGMKAAARRHVITGR